MPYATYLQNTQPGHHKHYFIAVNYDARDGWLVRVAWGRIGTIFSDKTYTGGKGGDAFRSENNAEAYARAIVKAKISEGYTTEWTGREPWPALDTGDDYDGEEPVWWTPASARTAATTKAVVKTKVSDLKRKLKSMDDDVFEKPKVKAKTTDESTITTTKKEEHHGTRRPRIQITPWR